MHEDSRRFDPTASALPTIAASGGDAERVALTMNRLDLQSLAASVPTIDLQRQLRWRPSPVSVSVRGPVWLAVAAALAILGLLLAIQQVVRGAVQLGEQRRQTVAVQAEATWRCKALSGLLLRANCLSQLNAAPTDPARRGAESVDTASAVARAGL